MTEYVCTVGGHPKLAKVHLAVAGEAACTWCGSWPRRRRHVSSDPRDPEFARREACTICFSLRQPRPFIDVTGFPPEPSRWYT